MINTDDVLELLAVKLLGIVPEDEHVIISTNIGKPVALDKKSKAGVAFNNIARRMMGDDVPFMDLAHKDDLIQRLSRVFKGGGN